MVQSTWIALDVHARSVAGAALEGGSGELVRASLSADTDTIVRWVCAFPGELHAVYEAGPTGFVLARALLAAGVDVVVCAPSETPQPARRSQKSDPRDAEHLLRQLIAGALTAVAIPTVEQEAARELVRLRDVARQQLTDVRLRITALLLRHGHRWDQTTWTRAHRGWIGTRVFASPLSRVVLDHLLVELDARIAHRDALTAEIGRVSQTPPFRETVSRLVCLRGFDVHTAFTLTVEIGDWTRFRHAASVANYLGVTPSLQQSGERRVQGAITKSGSALARRTLIEAAQTCRRAPSSSLRLAARQNGQPEALISVALRAQRRTHHVYTRLRDRGKPDQVAIVASARELACFCWAIIHLDTSPPSPTPPITGEA